MRFWWIKLTNLLFGMLGWRCLVWYHLIWFLCNRKILLFHYYDWIFAFDLRIESAWLIWKLVLRRYHLSHGLFHLFCLPGLRSIRHWVDFFWDSRHNFLFHLWRYLDWFLLECVNMLAQERPVDVNVYSVYFLDKAQCWSYCERFRYADKRYWIKAVWYVFDVDVGCTHHPWFMQEVVLNNGWASWFIDVHQTSRNFFSIWWNVNDVSFGKSSVYLMWIIRRDCLDSTGRYDFNLHLNHWNRFFPN